MALSVSVEPSRRPAPLYPHDDPRGRKTPTPTAHNHAPRPGPLARIRHNRPTTRTRHSEDAARNRQLSAFAITLAGGQDRVIKPPETNRSADEP